MGNADQAGGVVSRARVLLGTLRWLADEEGARWGVLTELGRIGEPEAFEQAVRWALENRPCLEEAKAHICRLKSGAIRPTGVRRAGRSVKGRTAPNGPHPRRATGKKEKSTGLRREESLL